MFVESLAVSLLCNFCNHHEALLHKDLHDHAQDLVSLQSSSGDVQRQIQRIQRLDEIQPLRNELVAIGKHVLLRFHVEQVNDTNLSHEGCTCGSNLEPTGVRRLWHNEDMLNGKCVMAARINRLPEEILISLCFVKIAFSLWRHSCPFFAFVCCSVTCLDSLGILATNLVCRNATGFHVLARGPHFLVGFGIRLVYATGFSVLVCPHSHIELMLDAGLNLQFPALMMSEVWE